MTRHKNFHFISNNFLTIFFKNVEKIGKMHFPKTEKKNEN
jgi:hypothetical protein